jgi:hypothetical protein
MDRSVPENANPTVLNVSQLPTRKNKAIETEQIVLDALFDDIVMAEPSYLKAKTCRQLTRAPIDEQEIYGRKSFQVLRLPVSVIP